jgi:hypothetical protein
MCKKNKESKEKIKPNYKYSFQKGHQKKDEGVTERNNKSKAKLEDGNSGEIGEEKGIAKSKI